MPKNFGEYARIRTIDCRGISAVADKTGSLAGHSKVWAVVGQEGLERRSP
jgi:hypothetical protein